MIVARKHANGNFHIKGQLYTQWESYESTTQVEDTTQKDDTHNFDDTLEFSQILNYLFSTTPTATAVTDFRIDNRGNLITPQVIESAPVSFRIGADKKVYISGVLTQNASL